MDGPASSIRFDLTQPQKSEVIYSTNACTQYANEETSSVCRSYQADQRPSLTIMTHRNIQMVDSRVEELRDTLAALFCTIRTGVDNPMMNPSGSGGRGAFLVLKGELERNFSDWAEDEEDGAEGFLDALNDAFWIWMTMITQGVREDFNQGELAKEKEKEKWQKVFANHDTKGKGKKGKSKYTHASYLAQDELQWNETDT